MVDTPNRYFGIGIESVYGTGVSATHFLPATDDSISEEIEFVRAQTVEQMWPTGSAVGKYKCSGTISGLVDKQFSGLFEVLAAILGSWTEANPGTGLTYTYTYDGYNVTDTLKSLTILKAPAVYDGAATKLSQYVGCGVKSITFEFEAGGEVKYSFDFFGKTVNKGDTSTPSYLTDPIPATGNMVTVKAGAAGAGPSGTTIAKVRKGSITISLGMDEDAFALGSGFLYGLVRNGGYEVTGELEILFDNWDHVEKFWGAADVTTPQTSQTIIGLYILIHGSAIDVNGNYGISFDIPAVQYETWEAGLTGMDKIMQTIVWHADYLAADSTGLTVVVTSDENLP